MKILITGSGGMLARDTGRVLGESHTVIAPHEKELDITIIDNIRRFLKEYRPDMIVNCAAYTKVDLAEEEREKALYINGIAVQNLALLCLEFGISLCHIGTDYVFNGENGSPYNPYDATSPVNYYGESKLCGEKYIQWILNKFYIIRTSWLYGQSGENFVKTILRISRENESIRVVDDQRGSPTSTLNLSKGIKRIIESGRYGIYHYTDETEGGITWRDFASKIVLLSGGKCKVIPVTTSEFPTPAKRPAYSVLDLTATKLSTGCTPEHWVKELEYFIGKYKG